MEQPCQVLLQQTKRSEQRIFQSFFGVEHVISKGLFAWLDFAWVGVLMVSLCLEYIQTLC